MRLSTKGRYAVMAMVDLARSLDHLPRPPAPAMYRRGVAAMGKRRRYRRGSLRAQRCGRVPIEVALASVHRDQEALAAR